MKHSVDEIRLKGGAGGLLIDVPGAGVMNVRVQFRAGNRYAKSMGVYEVAHLMEHMAFGANAGFRDGQAYEAEFTKNGAYHNAWTSDFSIVYEAECADFEWDRVLGLQGLAICRPRFNEVEFRAERSNVRSELTGYMNEYGRLVWPRLQQAVGEVALTMAERLKTLGNIELADVREHWRRTHRAGNMRFIVVGDLRGRKRQIAGMIEEWGLGEGERFEVPRDDLRAGGVNLIRRKDASNLTFGFCLGLERKLDEKEMFAMACLNHILNGTMNSRIFGEARRRGLVYGMGSNTGTGVHVSAWDFEGEVNVESARELFDLIAGEVGRVLGGKIAGEDIEAAKSYALGRHQMGAQTAQQIGDYYADGYFGVGEVEDYARVPDRIRGIRREEMVELAREFAGSGVSGFAGVGNMEKGIVVELWERVLREVR